MALPLAKLNAEFLVETVAGNKSQGTPTTRGERGLAGWKPALPLVAVSRQQAV